MSILRISQLAERSGVPTSTLRYYERIGLVEPSGRTDNGYRVYDESTIERLAVIGRAKRLGMSLDDAATFVEAWFAGECEPVRDRLRVFVTGRLARLRLQIAEDYELERHLKRVQARLRDGDAVAGRCRADCGCDTDPQVATGSGAASPAIGCSLASGDAQRRVVEWRQLLASATSTDHVAGRVRAVFDPSPNVIAELARLCAAETACCPFFIFDLEITAASVVLTVVIPAEAEELLGWVFDPGWSPMARVTDGGRG